MSVEHTLSDEQHKVSKQSKLEVQVFEIDVVTKKAKQIAKYFRQERADYEYTKDVFRKLREISSRYIN